MIIHLWYSTAITAPMALFMKEALAPKIKQFYNSLHPSTDPRRVVCDEWDIGNRTVRCRLPDKTWRRFVEVVEQTCTMDFEAAEKSRREENVHPAISI
jgi:hypothetical protein